MNNLKNTWKIWYHSSKNSSWSNSSYKNIYEINNIFDLKFFIESLHIEHIKTGMFFVMKNNIFPTWEDKNNKFGCCISYKIYDNVVKEKWIFIVTELLHNNLVIKFNDINGLSIVPKKNYCIIKLWLKKNLTKNNLRYIEINDELFNKKNALVKKNLT